MNYSESELEIEFSIKLPLRAIIDFDIDYYNYYILLVSSEGDVSLYDFDKTKAADLQITNNRMRLSSRETVTHHKKFEKINDDQLQKLLL